MEAAIAAMCAPAALAPPSSSAPVGGDISAAASVSAQSDVNRKRRMGTTAGRGEGGGKKKHRAQQQTTSSPLKPLLSHSLESAGFTLNSDDSSSLVDTRMRGMCRLSAEAAAIRTCFIELWRLKHSVLRDLKECHEQTLLGKDLTPLRAIIHNLSFASLLATGRAKPICASASIMASVSQLSKMKTTEHSIGTCATVVRILAKLDYVYMELLPVALSLQNKKERADLLPNPATWLAATMDPVSALTIKPSANPLFRYLQLRNEEAQLISLPALLAQAVQSEGLSDGPVEGTMRGSDPVGCGTMRLWQEACRDRVCQWAAFACPDRDTMRIIKTFCEPDLTLLEIGAGTGYWAKCLRREGVTVVATDKKPTSNSTSSTNDYHGFFPSWTTVEALAQGHMDTSTSRQLSSSSSSSSWAQAPNASSCGVLLLVYPPPQNAMARNALTAFGGERFVYVGEFGGDTADAAFEDLLVQKWSCVGVKALPNWGNTAASASFWVRTGSASDGDSRGQGNCGTVVSVPVHSSLSVVPVGCSGCGTDLRLGRASGNNGDGCYYRDRLTRRVYACSVECTAHADTVAALAAEMESRHLSALSLEKTPFEHKWRRIEVQRARQKK